MKCPKCGAELVEGALFCKMCGNKIEAPSNNLENEEPKTKIIGDLPEKEDNSEPKTVIIHDGTNQNPNISSGAAKQPSGNPVEYREINAAQAPVNNYGEYKSNEQPAPENVPGNNAGMDEDTVFCPACGAKNPIDSLFCGDCGYKFELLELPPVKAHHAQESHEPVNNVPDTAKKKAPAPKKKSKVWIPVTIASVVALLVIAALLILFVPALAPVRAALFGGSKSSEYTLNYIKDNELYIAEGGRYEPQMLCGKYTDGYDLYSSYNFGNGLAMTDDNRCLYIKKINYNGCGDLCIQKPGNSKSEERIASSVQRFTYISNNKIVYIDEDNKFYITDYSGNKEKISSEVSWYNVSEDKKTIVFAEDSGDESKLYYFNVNNAKDGKNKIATVTTYLGGTNNFEAIAYLKDDSLYVMKNLKDEEKLDSDVIQDYSFEDNGLLKIYYLVDKGERELTLYDFIDDDMASSDAAIFEPNIADYQTTVVKDGFWGARETTETDDAYYEEYNKYIEKTVRDDIREYAKNYSIETMHDMELFYYDSSKKDPESIETCFGTDESFRVIGRNALYLAIFDESEMQVAKMSQIYNDNSGISEDLILQRFSKIAKCDVIIGDKRYELGLDDIDELGDFYSDDDGKYIYYTYGDLSDEYDLYRIEPENGELKHVLMDDELVQCNVSVIPGSVVTMKDVSSDWCSADMYVNGEKVASDVYPYVLQSMPDEDNVFYYMTDYKDGSGTLNKFIMSGKKTVEISDDALWMRPVLVDGKYIAYLRDYSSRSETGDLMLFDGKESRKIDTDVSHIMYDVYADYNDY